MLIFSIDRTQASIKGLCSHCEDHADLQYMETFDDGQFVAAGDYCTPICALNAAKAKQSWMSNFYGSN